jgi:hypothetical protein
LIITEKAKGIFLLDSQNPLQDILKSRNERIKKFNKGHIVPIYCYRYIGICDNATNYLEELRDLECNLKKTSEPYLIIKQGLTSSHSNEEIEKAVAIWDQFEKWENDSKRSYIELYRIVWDTKISNTTVNWTIKRSLSKILELFDDIEKSKNQSIRRNYGLSLILWVNSYLSSLFSGEMKSNSIPKFIFWGAIRRNEAYFFIFLSMLGCDALYISATDDKEFNRIDLRNTYVKLIEHNMKIEIYDFPKPKESRVTIGFPAKHISQTISPNPAPIIHTKHIEKSYEELAKLSDSIVMINVYDDDHVHCGSGSGVVIDEDGTIVTNYHVIEDGSFFGILFENNKSEYITHTVISNNGQKDLALLQIDCKTRPIPIKSSDSLKRGQQIVAIGSPLGLMNTISDGIIAGFRSFDDQNFIQITAPISPGSSGGALLDRYGSLVGITTGGYTKGQNLNLAIPSIEITKLLLISSFNRRRKT